METQTIVGAVLVLVGGIDALAAVFVVGPRVKDPNKKLVVMAAVLSSAVMLMGFGIAVLAGAVNIG